MTEKDNFVLKQINDKKNEIERNPKNLSFSSVRMILSTIAIQYSTDTKDPSRAVPKEVSSAFFDLLTKMENIDPGCGCLYHLNELDDKRMYAKLIANNPEAFAKFACNSLLVSKNKNLTFLHGFIDNACKGNPNVSMADIYLRAYKNPKIDEDRKQILGCSAFYSLMRPENKEAFASLAQRQPELVGELAEHATFNFGAFFHDENLTNSSVFKEWMNKNPEMYAKASAMCIYNHCLNYDGSIKTREAQALVGMIDKDFMKNNPEIAAQFEAVTKGEKPVEEALKGLIERYSQKTPAVNTKGRGRE